MPVRPMRERLFDITKLEHRGSGESAGVHMTTQPSVPARDQAFIGVRRESARAECIQSDTNERPLYTSRDHGHCRQIENGLRKGSFRGLTTAAPLKLERLQ